MAGFRLLVVCAVLVSSLDQVFARKLKCTDDLRKQRHTLCSTDSPRLIKSGVSGSDRRFIVNLHNELRGNVQPPATDMPALKWDRKLEAVAQKKANQCIMKHDEYKQRRIAAYGVAVGQNLFSGSGKAYTWKHAIMDWHKERNIYKYGKDGKSYLKPKQKIGHYTQIVHNRTVRVGCGYAKCSKKSYYFACNYAIGQGSTTKPYTKGKRCGACPLFCKNGLCDCGGKLCKNGGKLNTRLCKCKCPKLYTGSSCEKLKCPKKDSRVCGTSFHPKHCKKYYNVPWWCPYMCGVCKNKVDEHRRVPHGPQCLENLFSARSVMPK